MKCHQWVASSSKLLIFSFFFHIAHTLIVPTGTDCVLLITLKQIKIKKCQQRTML